MANDDDLGQLDAEGLAQLFATGQQLHAAGQLQNAHGVYALVLKADPEHPGALQAGGILMLQLGQPQRALEHLDRLADPSAAVHRYRAEALRRLDRLDEALAASERAVALDGANARLWRLNGELLRAAGRHAEAEAALSQALALAPDDPVTLAELAAARLSQGRAADALVDLDSLIDRHPQTAQSHFLRGNALRLLMRTDEAVAAYDQALALKPGDPIIRFNRANALLLRGDWAEGFAEYEHRHECPGYELAPRDARRWNGDTPLVGKTLLITPELYFGDLIQFSRFALLAERLGAAVILTAPPAAHRLLSTLSPTIRLIAPDQTPPPHDLYCPLMSLPGAFGSRPEAVFAETPYLSPEPERVAHWRREISDDGLKVGVIWQGSVQPYALPLRRAFPLAALKDIGAVPGVRLISLQKHHGLEQLDHLPDGMRVETLRDFDEGPDMFLDTAAAMACCDLVISCDTGTAHLAGALGVKTWVALPFLPDWRYLTARADSPWYPTMRLFRQTKLDDWTDVFAAMREALA